MNPAESLQTHSFRPGENMKFLEKIWKHLKEFSQNLVGKNFKRSLLDISLSSDIAES
jgi:hypothetical protein